MTDKEKLEKLKKLADAMYYAAQHLTTDASMLHKAMDEYHKFVTHEYIEGELVSKDMEAEFLRAAHNLRERPLLSDWFRHFYLMGRQHTEPVSEEFKIALEKKVREAQDWTYIEEEGGECPLNEEFGAYDLEEFAMWGANWQKEQMMAKAVDAVVKIDAGGYPYVDRTIELYDYDKDIPLAKRGDKVKVLVIKED